VTESLTRKIRWRAIKAASSSRRRWPHLGYAIFSKDGIPAHGAGVEPRFVERNDLSVQNAERVLEVIRERDVETAAEVDPLDGESRT
jgi:hypothetical protein